MTTDDNGDLGACCVCGGSTGSARNVIMLGVRNQIPGHGWGCFVCDLPADGAVAVLCEGCLDPYLACDVPLRFACRGYPGSDGRVPIGELVEPHDHDQSRHGDDRAGAVA